MSLRIVQLGTPRAPGEGSRIGTVRRPPRGVPKAEFASRNYYDTWLPELSPEPELMQAAQAAAKLLESGDSAEGSKQWKTFEKQFRKQLAEAPAARTLDLLAALSHSGAFSIGCYCDEESRCHRSILRGLLQERGADITA
ncbi:DUF488 domain-containing protein [Comamonas fluminis]|uniref:DUF488 domain-containing protein n=1 Tax=Comamonas fluminis TaxID=2796366 RepID=UPI001C4789A9|nr:DUF488 domain-containing protein [Comamonas fluminis]